ncbi:hypothetical protein PINS_up013881 [Pythium insidiosum]|nr:hypothetical protein PINS_up013881 [Pythium insidiosum]
MRYVTATVDATVVTPVATRLANSVANPYVLSYFIWEYIKRLTPQRARDLTRLLSTAVSDAVEVLGAEQAQQLGASTKRLQDHLVKATVSPQGRDVLLNAVATAAKTAQALNTPETRAATLQLFETFQSFVDFFASTDGRHVIAAAGECVTKACEVAASPEASVLLAEVATNICHALEVEALRRHAEEEEAEKEKEKSSNAENDQEKPLASASPSSSAAETSFETESTMSDMSLPPTTRPSRVSAAARLKEKSATRSARIEKDVLLKMGVDPTMIAEIQRVLDRLREEEEQAAGSRSSAHSSGGGRDRGHGPGGHGGRRLEHLECVRCELRRPAATTAAAGAASRTEEGVRRRGRDSPRVASRLGAAVAASSPCCVGGARRAAPHVRRPDARDGGRAVAPTGSPRRPAARLTLSRAAPSRWS